MKQDTETSKHVQVYPAVADLSTLSDIVARVSWHFSHASGFRVTIPIDFSLPSKHRFVVPEGFDPAVQEVVDGYAPAIDFRLTETPEQQTSLLSSADIILKRTEGDVAVDNVVKAAKKPVYRIDPNKVRQEGSFYIQCAFDHSCNLEDSIESSRRKLHVFLDMIGKPKRSWVLATGPSIDRYVNYEYDGDAVIVCNSVVLDEQIMARSRPVAVVFADPIFHFGVSEYAGKFRQAVKLRLDTSDIWVIVPLKYYGLLVSKFPDYADRIIGIPHDKEETFNLDLRQAFRVKSTANILTMLLLPLATTLSRQVNLLGCDGRPLEDDKYFWGHGKSVQINDKMQNIQAIHPGFFAIDYNEYYFEHCHVLENLLRDAEDAGWRIAHRGPSHIPALRDRSDSLLALPLAESRALSARARQRGIKSCVLLEPDGLGLSGHYVRWHRNFIYELGQHFGEVTVLCHRKQDTSLYPCRTMSTFTSHSWGISRSESAYGADFEQQPNFQRFVDELIGGLSACASDRPGTLSVFVYYGSVQILRALQIARRRLLGEGLDIRCFVCLFHESVILDSSRVEPRYPVGAGKILMEAAAQIDTFCVVSVTERLAKHIRSKFDVRTGVLPNPPPNLTDAMAAALFGRNTGVDMRPVKDTAVVLFPANPREEKGAMIVSDLLAHLRLHGCPSGIRFVIRASRASEIIPVPGVEVLPDDVSDDEYRYSFDSADVIVIPYLAPAFSYRTSGILVDALISQIPIIAIRGTWLGDEVQGSAAGLAVSYKGPLTIIAGVKVLLMDNEGRRKRYMRATAGYLAQNSWRNMATLPMR